MKYVNSFGFVEWTLKEIYIRDVVCKTFSEKGFNCEIMKSSPNYVLFYKLLWHSSGQTFGDSKASVKWSKMI